MFTVEDECYTVVYKLEYIAYIEDADDLKSNFFFESHASENKREEKETKGKRKGTTILSSKCSSHSSKKKRSFAQT